MAAVRRKIRAEDVHGLKYFKALRGLIERLHFVGTARDKAGNRELHMDQYCTLILLYERAVLARTVEPDRMYIMDRGYAQFALWNVIVAKNSSDCCRIRDNSAHAVVQTLELADSDIAAGVVSDEVVSFDAGSKARIIPDHPVRIVTVKATPHRSGGKTGGGRTGPNCDGFLRIATNRLDLPAELVGELYRLRWLIENFFRMFKQLLGCRHLLSTKTNGVGIQVFCGIIACLLIMLYTGRQPAKRTFEMVCFFLSGWASPEELERHIESLPQPA